MTRDRPPAGIERESILSALRAYFDGQLSAIDDRVTDGEGTEFQRRVWLALRQIPAGSTCSYGELARRVGAPKASRAVGAANIATKYHDRSDAICPAIIGV